ncbi:MAG: REP-associated tyrosine transposase [Flavobacteriales bacterium]
MDGKYRISEPEGIYFLSFSTIGWVDVFTRIRYRDIVVDSLNFCISNKGFVVYSWVIMSNHMHLVCKSTTGNLPGTIRDFKSYTAKQILKSIMNEPESRREWMLTIFNMAGRNNINNKDFQFWRHDNHAIEVYSNAVIDQKIDYIHNNPVEAGIVAKAEDYLYSSAGDYCEIKGLVNVEIMERSGVERI